MKGGALQTRFLKERSLGPSCVGTRRVTVPADRVAKQINGRSPGLLADGEPGWHDPDVGATYRRQHRRRAQSEPRQACGWEAGSGEGDAGCLPGWSGPVAGGVPGGDGAQDAPDMGAVSCAPQPPDRSSDAQVCAISSQGSCRGSPAVCCSSWSLVRPGLNQARHVRAAPDHARVTGFVRGCEPCALTAFVNLAVQWMLDQFFFSFSFSGSRIPGSIQTTVALLSSPSVSMSGSAFSNNSSRLAAILEKESFLSNSWSTK